MWDDLQVHKVLVAIFLILSGALILRRKKAERTPKHWASSSDFDEEHNWSTLSIQSKQMLRIYQLPEFLVSWQSAEDGLSSTHSVWIRYFLSNSLPGLLIKELELLRIINWDLWHGSNQLLRNYFSYHKWVWSQNEHSKKENQSLQWVYGEATFQINACNPNGVAVI